MIDLTNTVSSVDGARITKLAPFLCIFSTLLLGCDDNRSPYASQSNAYTTSVNAHTTSVRFPEYAAVIKHGNPFGIISLEMTGQPENFVHPDLPLADWEWFRYDIDGPSNVEKHIKLIEPAWGPPTIAGTAEQVRVAFSRRDVLLRGITLRTKYTFAGTGFDVEYVIENDTADLLPEPYVMVGFPGFSNQKWISAVALNSSMRFVNEAFGNFWEEAQNSPYTEYTLLEKGPIQSLDRPMKGLVAITAFGSTYLLQSSFSSGDNVRNVRSAHVNKHAYLTSHLYVNLEDIGPGESSSVMVHYSVSRSRGGRASSPWQKSVIFLGR